MHLDARRADGESRRLCIAISTPERDPNDPQGNTYRTLLEVDGFFKPRYIYGEGSLQSLTLTIPILEESLAHIPARGWTLYYPGTDDVASPDLHLFGRSKK
ncbi:hypothetical protein Pla52n_59230 [Stieleria varia]|uniref:Uncharacterized protein n=2 Tax=Stieleria varia TaxID=2528005 RepID=A0A5C6A4E7_9BACT|nr:hypothetical protein Pla52n_59230 [Stieleria varia]